ncbi:ketol-acid reductoisomerase [Parvularcula bermudensis HTCC2503]|uniref:Ketol-acid reductoisomerase (NADP(+)) n=1 Tax=Parvularcula bermudensis (strain ATCC BAA-594 / HTCC2503 / KCTC 12087) TaxID=314260 RepID=E0THN5_PARBH|nr:ketol-acid reductoisomerase [Parvularcula bermudensis]ADM09331.1 ketol-acid reductoisomerase [Parvularcula bermudensis HTCC2503]
MATNLRAFTKDDVTPALKGTTVAVIGYGSQGRAHALNMKDSGLDVIIGARPGGPSDKKASEDGFRVMSPAEAAAEAGYIALTAPDMAHAQIFEEAIAPNLKAGDTLMFAHGFSVIYGQVTPPKDVDVILVAPKGPGDLVRREYERGRGVPCLFAVHQDATGDATAKALHYADAIGGTAAAVFETTFQDETETDLFGEQAVLCGGATELVVMGFETLVEAGYPPELAYYECLHELKLIVDLLNEGGLAKMHEFISETAIYGDLVSGPRVIDDTARERMRAVLRDIQTGTFARNWILENKAGKPAYNAMLQRDLDHPIEEVGRDLRSKMSWLKAGANNADQG